MAERIKIREEWRQKRAALLHRLLALLAPKDQPEGLALLIEIEHKHALNTANLQSAGTPPCTPRTPRAAPPRQ